VFRAIYKFIFRIWGWRIEGGVPDDLPKYVLIAAPHTSMWDFLVGLCVRSILRLDTLYVAKKELFRFPLGIFMRATGGYPVDRGKAGRGTDAIAELFEDKERFSICITPEGTRRKVEEWKTGFWYVARKAQVPIVMVSFNFKTKVVEFLELFYPTDDIDRDMETIKSYYRTIPGKRPDLGVE